MGQLAGTTFGIGTPTTYPVAPAFWGQSPYAGQGFGMQSVPTQPYFGSYGIGAQPLPQLLQTVAPGKLRTPQCGQLVMLGWPRLSIKILDGLMSR